MPCEFCGEVTGHDVFCPVPVASFLPGGIATSDWVDALLSGLGKQFNVVFPPECRVALTEAYALHHRHAENTGYKNGATAMQAKLNAHPDLTLASDGPLLTAHAQQMGVMIATDGSSPALPPQAPNVATVVNAAHVEVLAAAPAVKTVASDLKV